MKHSLKELKQLAEIGIAFAGIYRGRRKKTLLFDILEREEVFKTISVEFAKDDELDKIPVNLQCYVVEGAAPNNRSYSLSIYDTQGERVIYLEEPPRELCH